MSDTGANLVAELQRENALLREDLREQWEANHYEHCTNRWPHPEGEDCHWPLPEILKDAE